jgi:hypothetical protein
MNIKRININATAPSYVATDNATAWIPTVRWGESNDVAGPFW